MTAKNLSRVPFLGSGELKVKNFFTISRNDEGRAQFSLAQVNICQSLSQSPPPPALSWGFGSQDLVRNPPRSRGVMKVRTWGAERTGDQPPYVRARLPTNYFLKMNKIKCHTGVMDRSCERGFLEGYEGLSRVS